MSYELIRPVDSIENPDITQDFKVTKPHPDAVNDLGREQLLASAKIFTSNKLIDKVLEATTGFKLVPYEECVKLGPRQFFKSAVVVCGPYAHLTMRELGIRPAASYMSLNLRLTNDQLIVLQRPGNAPLLDYVLDFTPADKLPERLSHQAQLKLKFDLDDSTGFICQLP